LTMPGQMPLPQQLTVLPIQQMRAQMPLPQLPMPKQMQLTVLQAPLEALLPGMIWRRSVAETDFLRSVVQVLAARPQMTSQPLLSPAK